MSEASRLAPVRMCMGCSKRAHQASLMRVKVSVTGRLELARGSRNLGRSGYLHPQPQCWKLFASRKGAVRALARSFSREDRTVFVESLREEQTPKSEVSGYVA